MNHQVDNRPIGVFDSGLGGLTVVRSLRTALPGEDIIYLGDTGRVPYGTRSRATIERYARQDESFLLSQGVKMIIAACGTVSSVAPHTGNHLPVPFIEVVGPAAESAVKITKNGKIGIIGTPATVASGAYESRIKQHNPDLQVFQQGCALFVPLVEEGWTAADDQVTFLTAQRYLQGLKNQQVDTVILGCTHYPIISHIIAQVMGPQCALVNSGHVAATAAAWHLCEHNMLNERRSGGKCEFFVSDRTENFSKIAGIFLGEDIEQDVQHVEIDLL